MNTFNRKKISMVALISASLGLISTAFSTEHNHVSNTSLSKPQIQTMKISDHEHKQDENAELHKDNGHSYHERDHKHENEENTEYKKSITLSPEKISIANIVIKTIHPRIHFTTVYAPGEIKVNGYQSYVVSPRTESVIIKRHAILGEHVNKGQSLVTLFSEAMAQAQADYLIASTEWQRVKKLGNKTLSESQLLNVETAFNAAYGRLFAFGLTDHAIKTITQQNTTSFGQYTLTAQRAGIVLSDDFAQGQRVAAGDEIMLLADENDLWVEAKVAPSKKLNLSINSPAVVTLDDQHYKATVIQEAHTIDPITRTRIVRLTVANIDDALHSGMFVSVNFQFKTNIQVMAVPEEALMRNADGDWTVFVEDNPGVFNAIKVELGRSFSEYREIKGLPSGSKVVIQGAFFVASEVAKGGFDPHNH